MKRINLSKIARITEKEKLIAETAKIEMLCEEMQGKSRTRTINANDIFTGLAKVRKACPVTAAAKGIKVFVFPNACRVPGAYEHEFMQSAFTLECDGKAWYLVNIMRENYKRDKSLIFDFSACDSKMLLNSILN